jgi:hypothetical protein
MDTDFALPDGRQSDTAVFVARGTRRLLRRLKSGFNVRFGRADQVFQGARLLFDPVATATSSPAADRPAILRRGNSAPLCNNSIGVRR